MAEVGSPPLTLACSRCKQDKPIGEFRRRPNRPETGKRLGRWSHCQDCERERRLTPAGREQQGKRMERFRKKLRDTNLSELRRREREGNLRRLYGMTAAEFDAKLAAQGGGCAICGGEPGGRWKRRLHVDHNHQTGAVRGLLCHGCNVGIGSFAEDPARLLAAIEYLKKHAEPMTVTQPIS